MLKKSKNLIFKFSQNQNKYIKNKLIKINKSQIEKLMSNFKLLKLLLYLFKRIGEVTKQEKWSENN